jgi:hypothetical protein
VIVRFVDMGRIVDHHCLEVLVRCADIGGFNYHDSLDFLYISMEEL